MLCSCQDPVYHLLFDLAQQLGRTEFSVPENTSVALLPNLPAGKNKKELVSYVDVDWRAIMLAAK